ncbi:MAG: hypothetical protein ACO3A4_03505 [Silvanigrellaceae bacterium]
MTKQENIAETSSHLAFEQLIFEAFKQRNEGKNHWADGLIHVAAHEQISKIAYHHQHSQYHIVLYWLENFFANAARWIGVRELARLALDFLENSKTTCRDAESAALQFIDSLSGKREHPSVSQLECLMRCGMTVWRLRCAPFRHDLAQLSHDKGFSLMSLIEHKQAAVVESAGEWSLGSLWKSTCNQGSSQILEVDAANKRDAVFFFRRDELNIDYDILSIAELKNRMEPYLE